MSRARRPSGLVGVVAVEPRLLHPQLDAVAAPLGHAGADGDDRWRRLRNVAWWLTSSGSELPALWHSAVPLSSQGRAVCVTPAAASHRRHDRDHRQDSTMSGSTLHLNTWTARW